REVAHGIRNSASTAQLRTNVSRGRDYMDSCSAYIRPGGGILSIDIGDNRRRREKRAGDGKAHHADPAETDEQDRAALGALRVTFERSISGKPRAHERPGEVRGQRRVIKQVALMPNQNVGSKAAV